MSSRKHRQEVDSENKRQPLTQSQEPKLPLASLQLDPLLQRVQLAADSLSPADVSQLQRSIGNQALGKLRPSQGNPNSLKQPNTAADSLQRILDHSTQVTPPAGNNPSPVIQPNRALELTGDPNEQEADQAAHQVVISHPSAIGTTTQRQEEEEEMQMKPASLAGGGPIPTDLESQLQRSKGGGQFLSANIRRPMEDAFGADFSGVKIHTGAQSDNLNQSIQARAFTTGQDIFFRQGAYDPGSSSGQELLAHELTHVVQQQPGVISQKREPKPGRPAGHIQRANSQLSSTPMIQRNYAALSPMSRARVDQQSEERYAAKTQEFEFKMSPKIMNNSSLNAVVDILLARVRRIVDAWAASTGRELGQTYEREFGWSGGDDYYGAFEMTAANIKQVFEDTSQPMRAKLKLVYNAVRNNNLAKWLKLAAIELDRQAKGKKARNWKIKTATSGVMERDAQGRQTGNFNQGVTLEKEVVKSGFAEKSGLSESLSPEQVANFSAAAESQKQTTGARSKRDVFGHDRFGAMMNWSPATTAANQERRGNASQGLSLAEQRTLSVADVPDLTDAEIDQLYKQQGKPKPDATERARFRSDPQSKIHWGQGGEYYDIELGSTSAQAAAAVKARMEAGISGSTDLMLHAMQNLGLGNYPEVMRGMRLALAGWMMANRDHSFYEIYKAAESYGLPFDIDPAQPGQEYESAANLSPMKREHFADTLPENVFPRYFLSTPYKDVLAGSLTEPAKDQDAFKASLQGQGVPATTLDTFDERTTAELARLGEVVAAQTIDVNERMVKKQQTVRRIRQHSAFIYLGNTLGEAEANKILTALLRSHHGYKGVAPSGSSLSNTLIDVGIPRMIIELLPPAGITDLDRIRLFIHSAIVDPATNQWVFRDPQSGARVGQLPQPILARLSSVLSSTQVDHALAVMWQTYHGSAVLPPAMKASADTTRQIAKETGQTPQAFLALVDAGVPRGYLESATQATLYDLHVLVQQVKTAAFDKSGAPNAPANNQAEMGRLRANNNALMQALGRPAELILAALVRHYHGNTVLSDEQMHLADFAEMMTSRQDRERTGTTRQLDDPALGSLSTPKTTEDDGSQKQLRSTQYWSNRNARSRLQSNTSLLIDEYKKKLVARDREKAYEIFLKYSKEVMSNGEDILQQQMVALQQANEIELAGYLGMVSDEYMLEILPPEIRNNINELQGLNDKEIGAIFKYTTAEYVPIVLAANSLGTAEFTEADVTDPDAHKWGSEGGTGALATLKYTNPMMKALISGLDKMTPYNGKVYRGEESRQELDKKNEQYRQQYAQQRFPPGQVDFRAYPLSTSTTEDAPKKAPGGDKFDIFYEISGVKTGKSIELLSNSPEEQEVLFAPGARFAIDHTATKNGVLWVYMVEL